MSTIKLFLFGPPRLERDGVGLTFSQRKDLALFVYLAVNRQPFGREALAALFWPESNEQESRASLRRSLYRIRNLIHEGLNIVGSDTVQLGLAANIWVDIDSFRSLVQGCLPGGAGSDALPFGCQKRLEQAASLYSGDFLAGFTLRDCPAFDDWQFFEAESLKRSLAQILVQLLRYHQTARAFDPAIEYARRWSALDPLHEPAHRQLMELYARAGQQSAAIRQYEMCANLLRTELGVEPEPETTALYERIRKGELAEEAQEAGRVPAVKPVNFPAYLTPFVGRETELSEIYRILNDPACRLLTLIGPGGVGKTRLAVQAVTQLPDQDRMRFTGGIYFFPLPGLGSLDDIAHLVAGILGLSFHAQDSNPPSKQLLDFLRSKEMLLVLDNFEHLINESTIRWVVELLAAAPGVVLLVTSRVWLNLQGEQLYQVGGLSFPASINLENDPSLETLVKAYSAIDLFVRSAQRIKPGFRLMEENLNEVVQICRLVQGMSLGIELAAAWIELLSPAEIAAEIERSLDFLETDWHDLPERQRSMRAVFEASWRGLIEEERQALGKLTPFQGGFTRQAAEQAGGISLKMLSALAHKSWLRGEPGGRYHLHELLRQFAREQVQADREAWEAIRDRHSDFYATYLLCQGDDLKGPRQSEALAAIAAEYLNIRAAWLRLLERREFGRLLDLLPGLASFCRVRAMVDEFYHLMNVTRQEVTHQRAHPRARLLLIAATTARIWANSYHPIVVEASLKTEVLDIWELAGRNADPAQFGIWAIHLAYEYAWIIDKEAGIRQLRQCVGALQEQGDPWMLAFALSSLGDLVQDISKDEARACLGEAQELYHMIGAPIEWAETLRLLGMLANEQWDYDSAARYLEKAEQVTDLAGDLRAKSYILWNLGKVLIRRGEFERAFQTFERQRQAAATLGWVSLEAFALSIYSYESVRYGDLATARQKRIESMSLSQHYGNHNDLAWDYWEMGELCRVEGDLPEARRWYDQAFELFSRFELIGGMSFYERGLGDIAQLQGDFAAAYSHFDESLRMAREFLNGWNAVYALNGLGRAATKLARLELARQHFQEALAAARDMGEPELVMVSLAGLAGVSAEQGDYAWAVTLSTFVVEHPVSWRETKSQAAEILTAACDRLPVELFTDAQTAASALDLAAVMEAQLGPPGE
jgi:DNA-binding SARP family transcriptional activator/predicted ATPase